MAFGLSAATIGTIAGIGGTLIGASMQSNAAGNAAASQAASSAEAIAEQRRQYDLTRGDYAPYREVGVNALRDLAGQVNQRTSAADVMQDPGYQFGLDQGQQAIDRKVAASGGRVSGQAIKAAARFGTNYAATGYTAADQRRNDRLNRLAALANVGQTSTGASAQAGTASSNAISGIMQNQGDNTGAAQLHQGSVWGNTTNQIGALYGRYKGGSSGGGGVPGEAGRYPGDYVGVY